MTTAHAPAPGQREVAHGPVGARPAPTPPAVAGRFLLADLRRTAMMWENIAFVMLLPAVMYLMFGTQGEAASMNAGYGNVAAYVMISMAVYGSAMATTSVAGTTAYEHSSGWGRQLALTALSTPAYFLVKSAVAVIVALLPIALLFAVGAATGAELDSAGRWAAAFGMTLLVALPFSLYGLAATLLLRTEAASGIASGLLVVLAFFGNLFMPLSGTMLDIARWTPMYGAATLARWPIAEGGSVTSGGELFQEELWVAVVNIAVWTVVFAALCLLGSRRRTRR
ncbi:ABC transporter permease [Corynebacterium sp.]|uniref:ABC transporter permease n=1 Tax=Corynebacterium sp. TaxID=1720 RepID=UPI0026DD96D6|nr:ABC transporter permease [Corynebacterium sp.]MDO4611178.1 ABC transporter permease [Corynebacterium sp.]